MLSESRKLVVDRPQSTWLRCICSVEFDLDQGQKLEHIVPEDALSIQEQSDVSFHAFPDSMSMELHACSSVRDSLFFFRIRRDRLLYGFVFCRQRQDEKLARGGDQRAVVVVADHPFSPMLRPLSQMVGLEYFQGGPGALNEVWEEVKLWAAPCPSKLVQLLLKGHTLVAQLPPFTIFPPPAPQVPALHSRSSSGASKSSTSQKSRSKRSLSRMNSGVNTANGVQIYERADSLASMFHEFDVFGSFQSVLSKLWGVWELILTGQPLAVIAPSPGECSSAVAALISLIAPVPYSADFRPYYTIHDATFHELAMVHDKAQKSPGGDLEIGPHLPRLVGLTNKYFLKALPAWPNILSIGEKPALAPGLVGAKVPTIVSGGGNSRFGRFMPRNMLQAWRIKGVGPQILLSQHVEYLWMAEDPLVRPNWDLCKKINQMGMAGSASHSQGSTSRSDIIRKHFAVLTATFLEPFQPYFVPAADSTVRSGDAENPDLGPPVLPQFNSDEFLESLETWPFPKVLTGQVPVRRDLLYLYARFVDSQNFRVWFTRQQYQVGKDLGLDVGNGEEHDLSYPESSQNNATHIKGMVCKNSWDCGDEVRLVEDFVELESEIANSSTVPSSVLDNFCKVVSAMPPDLRETLLSSPARADLVQKLRAEAVSNTNLESILLQHANPISTEDRVAPVG